MAQFTGMDIAQVKALAAQMNNAAGEIQQLAQSLGAKLQGTAWVGPDRERFLADWTGQHQAQLNQVVQALQDASRRANANAAEQEQASNGG
jgi:uncharacterized protein YukE